MADHGQTDLPYGHYGNAIYDPEERGWQFQKVANDECRILTRLGNPAPATRVAQAEVGKSSDGGQAIFPCARRQKQIDALIRCQPGVQPAAALLSDLIRVSKAVEAAAAHHDPARGRRLSYGRVFDESFRRTVRAVAYATGSANSDVRIEAVQMQKQGWDDSRDQWLELPVLTGIGTIWKGPGAPVQQVSFAQPAEGGEALLAVRYITSTVIFRPVMRKHGTQRLDANPILELSIDQTGGVPHADIAFNPWYARQFAVIDQAGDWSVWEFISRESSKIRRVHAAASQITSNHGLDDGWARIMWVASPTLVLSATRSAITVLDTSVDPAAAIKMSMGFGPGSVRVLDVAVVPGHPAWCCVLTSTHLSYVHVVKDKNDAVNSRVVARMSHFRGDSDISLRLQVVGDGPDTLSLIKSAMASTTTVYRSSITEFGTLTVQEPTVVDLSTELTGTSKIVDYTVSSIDVRGKFSRPSRSTAIARLHAANIRPLGMTILQRDHVLVQQLYLSHPASVADLPGELPTWASKLEKSSTTVSDGFVVDDSEAEPVVAVHRKLRSSRREYHSKHGVDRTGDGWTISYERCMRVIAQAKDRVEHIDQHIDQTRAILENSQEGLVQPMQTIYELADAELVVNDIDAATAALSQLQVMPSTVGNELIAEVYTRVVLRPTGMLSSVPGDWIVPVGNLDELYDSIVSEMISPLSARVLGTVRLAKEQLARRMTATVSLASHVIQHESMEPPPQDTGTQDHQTQSQSQPSIPQLPRSGFVQSSQRLPGASQPQSSLPTPSPTGTPSISTQPSTLAASAVGVLSRFTTLQRPPPPPVSRPVKKVLSHWHAGSDVDSYDWLSTSRTIAKETEEEEADSQLTEKQRERLQRKAEKHLRRQRREAEASAARVALSSQVAEVAVAPSRAPSVYNASQQDVRAVPGSSQVLGTGAASQVLPGRFGGKMVVRKKRKQGF